MEYKVENDRLFRILDNGSKQQLGWVTDNVIGHPMKRQYSKSCNAPQSGTTGI